VRLGSPKPACRRTESLETKETAFDIQKTINRIAPRKDESPPSQSQATNRKRQGSLNDQSEQAFGAGREI
jgi:hypothetical protein